MKKLFKEPFFYFALIGGLAFYFHTPEVTEEEMASLEITLPTEFVEIKKSQYFEQYKRQPSEAELKAFVSEEIDNEILFREAWRLQLYVGDTVVRRRMIQKMRFLMDEGSASASVTEDEAKRFYDENSEEYVTAQRASFTHVLYSTESEAAESLALLNENGEQTNLDKGVAFPLGNAFSALDQYEINKYFGEKFFQALEISDDKTGTWQGPVESIYGFHLVKLSEIVKPVQQSFEQAYQDVQSKLSIQKRQESASKQIANIKQKYHIVYPEIE